MVPIILLMLGYQMAAKGAEGTTEGLCHWRKGGGGIRERTNAWKELFNVGSDRNTSRRHVPCHMGGLLNTVEPGRGGFFFKEKIYFLNDFSVTTTRRRELLSSRRFTSDKRKYNILVINLKGTKRSFLSRSSWVRCEPKLQRTMNLLTPTSVVSSWSKSGPRPHCTSRINLNFKLMLSGGPTTSPTLVPATPACISTGLQMSHCATSQLKRRPRRLGFGMLLSFS